MVTTDLKQDLYTGISTIRLVGEFSANDVVAVDSAVQKAAAECPTGLLVDLSQFRPDEDTALSLFATLTYHSQDTWGVPMLLFGADPSVRRRLRMVHNFVAVYEDRPQTVWRYAPMSPVACTRSIPRCSAAPQHAVP